MANWNGTEYRWDDTEHEEFYAPDNWTPTEDDCSTEECENPEGGW